MSTFRIGDRTLPISPERKAYARLRYSYAEKAADNRDDFLTTFDSTFADADELFRDFPATLEEVVEDATQTALADITSHGIYDVDERGFGARFASYLVGRENPFERFHEAYQEIVLSAAALDAYREERAADRGGIVGGGIGLEGAAAGMAVAAVANAALGFIGGIADEAGKALARAGDRHKKAALYDDPATKDGLADFVHDTFFRAHLAVAEIVNARRETPVFEPVSTSDEAKASALLINVQKDRVPAEARADVLFEALSLNPFADEVWFEWLSRFGDTDLALASAANEIGFLGLEDRKRELITTRVASFPRDTPERITSRLPELESLATFLGVSIVSERNALKRRADEIDLTRRSFRGKLYDTQAQAEQARANIEDQERRTVSGIEYSTQKEAIDVREKAKVEKNAARRKKLSNAAWVIVVFYSAAYAMMFVVQGAKPGVPAVVIGVAGLAVAVAIALTCPPVIRRLPTGAPKFAWTFAFLALVGFASLTLRV